MEIRNLGTKDTNLASQTSLFFLIDLEDSYKKNLNWATIMFRFSQFLKEKNFYPHTHTHTHFYNKICIKQDTREGGMKISLVMAIQSFSKYLPQTLELMNLYE